METDFDRRFGGIGRLYGTSAQALLRDSHVAVVGIGGVGSWSAEALARSGVGKLTLIDLDNIAVSNANRQIHALEDTFGMAKVSAMATRIRAINPGCRVREVEDFITVDNVAALLAERPDVVIDAIDQVSAKVGMIAYCRQADIPIVVAGGAGGKADPTKIRIDDLSRTVQDPLLARVRSQLRKAHGFSRDPRRKFSVAAVYSEEPLRQPLAEACSTGGAPSGAGLNCAGFGSSMCVTASFGLFAAAAAVDLLLGRK